MIKSYSAIICVVFAINCPPALAEDRRIHTDPDVWGRSLIDLGIVPKDKLNRKDLMLSIRAFTENHSLKFLISIANEEKFILDFFSGDVGIFDKNTEFPPQGWGEIEKKRVIDHSRGHISAQKICSAGPLAGSIVICQSTGCLHSAQSLFLVSRQNYSHEYKIKMSACNDPENIGTEEASVRTFEPLQSSIPSIIDLQDGTFVAWTWGLDIIRFSYDGATKFKPTSTFIVHGADVNKLLLESDGDIQHFYRGIERIIIRTED